MIVIHNKNDRLKKFEVISVGPGKRNSEGKYVPMDIKEGDIVLSNSPGIELDTIAKGLYCIYEEDIVGVLDGEPK